MPGGHNGDKVVTESGKYERGRIMVDKIQSIDDANITRNNLTNMVNNYEISKKIYHQQ